VRSDKPNVECLSAYETLIGNTPMIQLKVASNLTGCRILVKVSYSHLLFRKS
jgi:hypothetical protein